MGLMEYSYGFVQHLQEFGQMQNGDEETSFIGGHELSLDSRNRVNAEFVGT